MGANKSAVRLLIEIPLVERRYIPHLRIFLWRAESNGRPLQGFSSAASAKGLCLFSLSFIVSVGTSPLSHVEIVKTLHARTYVQRQKFEARKKEEMMRSSQNTKGGAVERCQNTTCMHVRIRQKFEKRKKEMMRSSQNTRERERRDGRPERIEGRATGQALGHEEPGGPKRVEGAKERCEVAEAIDRKNNGGIRALVSWLRQ